MKESIRVSYDHSAVLKKYFLFEITEKKHKLLEELNRIYELLLNLRFIKRKLFSSLHKQI